MTNEPIILDVFDDNDGDDKFINIYSLVLQWPFRLLIIGPSGCGETNLLINPVTKFIAFSKIYVYAKDLSELKYKYLENFLEDARRNLVKKKRINEEFFRFISNKDDIIRVYDLDRSFQNLIIFDDFLTEKDQNLVKDLFIRGRKKNFSGIYLTQSYYTTPKDIRLNCIYFIIYPVNKKREIYLILGENCTDCSKDEIIQKYTRATKNKFDYFMTDMTDCDKKYRKNFDVI